MKIKNSPDKLIWAAIIAYAAFFSCLSVLKYNNFIYNDFDLAIDAQTLWNIVHGSIYCSMHQIVFLGNHMRLILFLIAPLYAVFSSPVLLLILQSVSLALGAWPLYRMAKNELNTRFAFAIAVSYLLYPALMYMNLFEFHPTALSTCFLMFMLYYFYREKFLKFIVFGLLALSCQENIALLLITMGCFAFFVKKGRRWAVVPVVIGVSYFYLSIFKIIPYFNNGTIEFESLYSHLGSSLPQALLNMAANPLRTAYLMFSPENLLLLFQMFCPLVFLPLFSLPLLAVALPIFMQHMLSSRFMEHTIFYHYSAEIIPFVFFASVFGARRVLAVLSSPAQRRAFLWLLVIAAVISSVHLGPLGRISRSIRTWKSRREVSLQIGRFISRIPSDAPIAATFEFLPHLSNRKYLYSFHHFYSGKSTLSGKNFKLPEAIDYALINYDDGHTFEDFRCPESDDNLKNFFKRYNLKKIDSFEKIEFYKRPVNGKK